MTKAVVNSILPKTKGQVIIEYLLFALCLCVIALRATFAESPTAQSTIPPTGLTDSVYSLTISAVLIFSFVIWLICSLWRRKFLYRFSAIEIGLGIFTLAAIVAAFTAANKRTAITSFVTLLAPILMAILLVQILDSPSKIKLLLAVIAALGVVSAYQCQEQLFYWNDQQIKFYQQDPAAALAQQGITVNSLSHWLFEHRLYTKPVQGFFTTSNSAGSFAMLASFAAVALFIDGLKNRKLYTSAPLWLITCGIAVAAVIFGLVITRSKGAIVASLIAAAMFITFLCFGNWLNAHKKTILFVCLLLALAGGAIVVSYGLTHDRLPGGNSMLVRWQYWTGAAKMYVDHPVTGVGPGNFSSFYTHYKIPSAPETVKDPHNFLLSVITQYGPIGLVGFLAIFFMPLWKVTFSNHKSSSLKPDQPAPTFKTLAFIFLIVISAALLILRPMVLKTPPAASLEEKKAAVIILYIMPVVIFIIGFLLLTAPLHTIRDTKYEIRNMSTIAAALFCAIVGCLIHNSIDFAIFEPGVFTSLCAVIAALIASDSHQKPRTQFVLKPIPFVKVAAAIVTLLVVWAYLNYAFIPVAKAAAKTKRALNQLQYAHELLDQAAEDDRLDPAALNLNGRLYLQHYDATEKEQPALLKQAEKCFLAAIQRDRADFKNFERLTDVYTLLAESSTQQEKFDLLDKAFNSAYRAVKFYPGSGRLQFKLAEIAEQVGKTDIAVKHYKEAINIEDNFRVQFQQMYPGRKIFSRLGEERYQTAKQRIKALREQPTP